MKAAIIGGGNIGLALAEGLIQSGLATASDITITRRNSSSLEKLSAKGFQTTTDNAHAVAGVDTIFICVLPQQLDEALLQIRPAIRLESNCWFRWSRVRTQLCSVTRLARNCAL